MAKSNKKQEVDDWEALPAAGGVDDWEDVPGNASQTRAMSAQAKKPVSATRAAMDAIGAGAAQAATLGYAPRLIAKGAELLSSFQPDVIDPKTGKPIPRVDYKTARDASYQDLANIEAASPKTFMAANLAANMAIPGAAAKSVGGAALRAALQGAAYNPGDKLGEDSGLQLGERVTQGTLGGLFGAGTKVASDAIGAGSRAFLAGRAMKKPGFSRGVQEQIETAADNLQKDYISPRAKAAREALKEVKIKVRPDFLDGADAEGLQDAMRSRTPMARKAAKDALGYGSGKKSIPKKGDELVTMRGDLADRVRQILDSRGWKEKGALAAPEAIRSAEGKISAANTLRNLRDKAAPELKDNFGEQSYALGLRNEILDKAKNPQQLLTGQYWSDMGSKINDFDQLAGSNLRGLGQDIARGRWLNGRPPALIPHFLNEPARLAANVGAGVATPISPFMNKGISPATMKLILEEIMNGKELPREDQ